MIAFSGNRELTASDLTEGHAMQADLLTLEALITGTAMVLLMFGRMAVTTRRAAMVRARSRKIA